MSLKKITMEMTEKQAQLLKMLLWTVSTEEIRKATKATGTKSWDVSWLFGEACEVVSNWEKE